MQASYEKYDAMANDAYGKVVERNTKLDDLQGMNKSLRVQLTALNEEFDKLTKDILIIESDWEFLLLLQVYWQARALV